MIVRDQVPLITDVIAQIIDNQGAEDVGVLANALCVGLKKQSNDKLINFSWAVSNKPTKSSGAIVYLLFD